MRFQGASSIRAAPRKARRAAEAAEVFAMQATPYPHFCPQSVAERYVGRYSSASSRLPLLVF